MVEDLILERFGFYADIDGEQIYKYLPIVRSAIDQINSSLRCEKSDGIWKDRLTVLGALMCYHHYCMMCGDGQTTKLGNFSVTSSAHTVEASKQLLDEQIGKCSDLLNDNDFLFCKVG